MRTERKNEHYLALQQAFGAPWPGPVGELVTLEKGSIHLQAYSCDGTRITSLKVFDSEVLRQWQPQHRTFQYGCFPMVPWAGWLGDMTLNAGGQRYSLPANRPPHALHGMAYYLTWEIIDKTVDSLTLRMPLASPWPWQGEVVQTFLLENDALVSWLEVHSHTDTFLVSTGWHLRLAKKLILQNTGSLQVLFDMDWQEEAGGDELPTGSRIFPQIDPWDDCSGFYDGVKVRSLWPGGLTMTITSSTNSLVVFDKQPGVTCINPLTQALNVIDLTPEFVTLDKSLVIEIHWQFTSEP